MPNTTKQDPAPALRFSDYELDRERGVLFRGGVALKVQPQPLRALAFLIDRAPKIVSREALADHIWGDGVHVEIEQSLNYCIRQIRQVLDDRPSEPKFVETLPRQGYRFIATVTQESSAGDMPADDVDDSKAQSIADDSQARSVRQQLPPVIWWEHRGIDVLPQTKSIVVRPLKNTSGDDSQNYFAEILTEALVSELARIHQLKVFSSSAIPDPWIADEGLRNSAGILHLDMLVEGSMRRLSNKI
jgi:DNA-binding winged helix-turn-helix (wHTH) protein